jgi:hypothetical protein
MALHYVFGPQDRESFVRCRRQWDFAAWERGNWEPRLPSRPAELSTAIRDALDVYYFPGMWDWRPAIVLPLVRKALLDSFDGQRRGYLDALGLAELPAEAQAELDADQDRGLGLLEAYFAWAPGVDRFAPSQVRADIDVRIPDPDQPGRDLVSPDGRPVHYRDNADLLAIDAEHRYWLVEHRVSADPWPNIDVLTLSDRCLAWCWAWEADRPGMHIEGTIYNEVRLGMASPSGGAPAGPRGLPERRGTVGQTDEAYERPWSNPARQERPEPVYETLVEQGSSFRRVQVPRRRAEMTAFGLRLAHQAQEMIADHTVPYPSPTPEHCAPCVFRAPCMAKDSGGDVPALLAAGYNQSLDCVPIGKIGATSWSVGRGAAPPKIGGWGGRLG